MKITFTTKQAIGTADKMLYGHFLEHFHRQIYGGVYDPTSKFADEDGFRTDVIEALKRIKTPIIRWPGGCYVSAYDWKKGVGKDRPKTFDKAWRVEESNEFGTDEFIKLCKKIGCEPYICTNGGTGTAEEMSDWVEYCNLKDMGEYAKQRKENGYEEPHNVKYWSVGNENWGIHEIGEKDSNEWGNLVREASKMMVRVDPTIELSAASIVDLDWNIKLLTKAGPYLDWLSIHSYWEWGPDGLKNHDYKELMLLTGEEIVGNIDRVRAYLKALGYENKIKIAYDEWNLRGWYHPNSNMPMTTDERRKINEEFYEKEVLEQRNKNDINETYTMTDAVFSAAFLNTCLRNCDIVKMACFSPVVNTRGAIFTHKDGLVFRPQYFVFELYSNLLKDTVLKTWSENVPTMNGKINNKERTVDTVDIAITYGDGEYAVAATNKDPENEQTVEFDTLDGNVSMMRIHTLNGPSTESYNDIDRTEVGITVSEWVPFDGKATLAPHSVNVIKLK